MLIFLGYSTRHGSNVYRMFNLTLQSIIISRDISCLKVNYVKWKSRVKMFKTNHKGNNNSPKITMDTTISIKISTLKWIIPSTILKKSSPNQRIKFKLTLKINRNFNLQMSELIFQVNYQVNQNLEFIFHYWYKELII